MTKNRPNEQVSWWRSWFTSPNTSNVSTTEDVEFLRRQIRSLERAVRENAHSTIRREDTDLFTAKQVMALASSGGNKNVQAVSQPPVVIDNQALQTLTRERDEERERTERQRRDLEAERQAHDVTRERFSELQRELLAEKENDKRDKARLRNENNDLQKQVVDLKTRLENGEKRDAQRRGSDNESPKAASPRALIPVNLQGHEVLATILTDELHFHWNELLVDYTQYAAWSRKYTEVARSHNELKSGKDRGQYSTEQYAKLDAEDKEELYAIAHERDMLYTSMEPHMDFVLNNMKITLKENGRFEEGDPGWKQVAGSFGETDTWLDPPIIGREGALAILAERRERYFNYYAEDYTEPGIEDEGFDIKGDDDDDDENLEEEHHS